MELVRHIVKTSRNINLRPVGDLQKGEAGFRKDLWNKWKKEALLDSTSLIIGMGDYSDAFRTTVDKKLIHAVSEDRSAWSQLDEMLMKDMQALADELKPFRHRIIGLHCGHHHHQLMYGGCTCQYLCQLLKVRHLGFVALIQLILQRGNKNSSGYAVDIFSTHGCGGASNVASDLTNLERKIMPFWDCDLFLRGHSTRAYAIEGNPISRLSVRNGRDLSVKKKKRVLVNTGGFMEGYTQGIQSYVERSNLPQINLGWCVVGLHIPSYGEEAVKINAQAFTE